jgi:hypothetical protein
MTTPKQILMFSHLYIQLGKKVGKVSFLSSTITRYLLSNTFKLKINTMEIWFAKELDRIS